MLRAFTDSSGVEWRVWEVLPSRAGKAGGADTLSQSRLMSTPFANGWLCFECASEKRRLAPIPPDWQWRETHALEQLCAQATLVPARRRAPSYPTT